MIAGGNTLVVNPHPSGKRVAAEGVRRFNEAIANDVGIDNLICVIAEPTLESANALFAHRGVSCICVTGGPAVARAALNSGKRAIVAGPGNPPVVVDETADLDRAAKAIIQGASYDNNLLCIAEKEVFCVDSVFDQMMAAMERSGAVRLNSQEIERLTAVAITTVGEGEHRHEVAAKDFIGQDAAVLALAAGKEVPANTELVFGETSETNPFRARRTDDAVCAIRSLSRRGGSDCQSQVLRAWLSSHRDYPYEQRPQHDQDGPRDGHHTVRQEWSLHVVAWVRRRRLSVLLDCHAYGGRRHHAAYLHARTTLLVDRRPAHPWSVEHKEPDVKRKSHCDRHCHTKAPVTRWAADAVGASVWP